MPDITMCLTESCPIKGNCYRFQAPPNPYHQYYSNFKPDENGTCEHQLRLDDKQESNQQ